MTSGAQMILKRSSNSSMSSKGPRSPHILKTSLKSSKRLQNVLKFPQVLSRSSDPRSPRSQCPQSPRKSSKTTQSPQVLRSTVPRKSSKTNQSPEKILKKSSKVTQNVLKRASKSSRCSESLQNVPKVLSSLNNPQKVIKVTNVLKGSTKSSNPQKVLKVRKKF